MTTSLSESQIQVEICQALQAAGLFFFSVSNEAAGRSMVKQMQLVSMGLRAGVADLVVLLPGRVIFLEVKNAKGKQSKAQELFEKKVKSLGYEYFLVRSAKESLDLLLGYMVV